MSAERLDNAIKAAGVPIVGISVGSEGVSSTVRVQPASLQAAAQPTIDAFDWSDAAEAAWENLRTRADAIAQGASGKNADAKLKRAIAAVLLDEINTLRGWLTAFKAQVALATNLADLKTRVATLPNTPDRTLAQAQTALAAKINAGTVD